MASFKFLESSSFTVESPDVTYTDAEIVANYSYETVVVEGTKVSPRWRGRGPGCMRVQLIA